jgi:hypothetical protein
MNRLAPAALAAAGLLTLGAASARADSVTFLTAGEHPFTVPAGVHSLQVNLVGGAGGPLRTDHPVTAPHQGAGGYVDARLPVTPGEVLYVVVGGQGAPGTGRAFNGGGAGSDDGLGDVTGGGGGSQPSAGGSSGGGGGSNFVTPDATNARAGAAMVFTPSANLYWGDSAWVTPAAVSFPDTEPGAVSAPQPLSVLNMGGEDIGGATLGGADPGDFVIAANTCDIPMAWDTFCSVSLSFAPRAAGTRAATFSIGGETVALTGTGAAPPATVTTPPPAATPVATLPPAATPVATGPPAATPAPAAPAHPRLRIALATCRKTTVKGHARTTCATRLVSGPVAFTAVGQATVTRGGRVVATGVARRQGSRLVVTLRHVRGKLTPGRYALKIGGQRRSVTLR